MTEFSAHRAKVAAMAGESSAVPFEAAYFDGMTQIEGRDSEARESAHRGDNVGDAAAEELREIVRERRERREGTVEVILVNILPISNDSFVER